MPRLAVAFALVVLMAVVASPAQAMRLHANATRVGASEAQVRVTALTASRSQCDVSVHAGGERTLRLPTLVTSRRRATWRWEVPAGGPTGTWRLNGLCTHHGHVSRASASTKVKTSRLGARAGLMFPGSLAVLAGRYLHKPTSQTIAIDPNGSKGAGADGNPGEAGYCTWGAWNLAKWLGSAVYGPPGQNDAKYWAINAQRNGLPIGKEPRVGAVFVSNSGGYGHVGVVTAVTGPTSFVANEMNGGNRFIPGTDAHTNEFGHYFEHSHTVTDSIMFIYQPGTQPGAFVGHIVQWDGDTKKQKTAWLVGQDGKRRWIPTSAIFYCLKGLGVPGPDVLPAQRLDEYPDLNGQWVNCGPSGAGAGSGEPPTEPDTPPVPPPPAPGFNETVGGDAHTWTNHTNAGGTEGPLIPAFTTVAIACKLPGFKVADGNTWWYRVLQAPWSNQYYVSADAFYNNGQTSGSLRGTPFVDPVVPDC